MKYKRLEEAEHKQQDREDRKQLQFKLYSECTSMAEFMMKTTLAGVKLTFLEKAAFWTYYIANNYGSSRTPACMMAMLAGAVFTALALSSPTAQGVNILAKFLVLGIVSTAVSGTAVGGLCCFLKCMERQETIAARQRIFDKAEGCVSKAC